MGDMTLIDVSKAMSKIDICMMTTFDTAGALESRPMSNNKDVEYEGDSYFFALESASAVQDLQKNPQVSLSYIGHHHFYIGVTGKADLIQDKSIMEDHWVKDLEIWFEDGLDTPGLTLIHVKAKKLKYWDKQDEGEISL
jgi:general stress protein 26